ncbi:MAG: XRE family transcriptional regulator [Eubacteriales bacterium]|nr:XRE family transcriptional regulator [Eubacteriales bacterium]
MTKSTEELNNEIKDIRDIQDFFVSNQNQMLTVSLSEHLNMLLSEKNLHKTNIIHDSLLDRVYVYQIFSGRKFPSRNKLIALAFGMHLSVDETQRLLKISGNRELYAREQRDAIILFALHRDMTISDTNELLFERGLRVLGISQK